MGALGRRLSRLNEPPRGLVVDMDGVLYRGDRPMPGLREFFSLISDHPFVLLTNNSTVSALDCAAKLGRMGVNVPPSAILTVTDATARYLVGAGFTGSRALVLGSTALKEAVAQVGVELAVEGRGANVIVMGLDRTFTYAALSEVVRLVSEGAALVATSLDPVLLTEDGAIPGTGALVAAVRACVEVAPVCVGKPNPAMFATAASLLGVGPANSLVIGDNLASDIAGGAAAGARTALLLSGVTCLDEVTAEVKPDFVFPGLPELSAFLSEFWPRPVLGD
jgi:4-nitrophenyl phosphatase